jgi:hypothetical protein
LIAYSAEIDCWNIMRAIVLTLSLLALPNWALAFEPVTERTVFLEKMAGRSLYMGLFDLSLTVAEDGTIRGSALGWNVTGKWDWKDGLFCRDMDWSGMEITYNCQLVEIDDDKLRFTADAGAGRAASFTLR